MNIESSFVPPKICKFSRSAVAPNPRPAFLSPAAASNPRLHSFPGSGSKPSAVFPSRSGSKPRLHSFPGSSSNPKAAFPPRNPVPSLQRPVIPVRFHQIIQHRLSLGRVHYRAVQNQRFQRLGIILLQERLHGQQLIGVLPFHQPLIIG